MPGLWIGAYRRAHFVCICTLMYMPQQSQTTHSGSLSSSNLQFNILVVLEGSSDHTTALVFQDIAQIVRGGLHSLGYPSRVVYCANLVVDRCFVEGESLIVLAPHNLASYDLGGRSAVLEKQLLPPDAGEVDLLLAPQEQEVDGIRRNPKRSKFRDPSFILVQV